MGRDWQEWARVDAFFALAGQKDTSITEPLMEILKKEKNDGLKSEMIVGLGLRGDKRVAPYIVEILREYKRKYPKNVWDIPSIEGGGGEGGAVSLVVGRAYMALGHLKAKEYIDEFIEVIRDPELTWDFRGLVIQSLSFMGKEAKDAVPYLLELLEKDYSIPHYVLYILITALGDIGDKRAIPVLRKKLKEYKEKRDSLRIRDCVLSLALLGDKEVLPDLKKLEEKWRHKREVEGYKGPETEEEKRIKKALRKLGLKE
jgi:HEAT repeat protein